MQATISLHGRTTVTGARNRRIRKGFGSASIVSVARFIGVSSPAFFGIPPTGRKAAIAGHAILRIEDGKVENLVAVFDDAGMLRQLGVLPSG